MSPEACPNCHNDGSWCPKCSPQPVARPSKERLCRSCYQSLAATAQVESLKTQLAAWVKANGPGGWIDELRKGKGVTPETGEQS